MLTICYTGITEDMWFYYFFVSLHSLQARCIIRVGRIDMGRHGFPALERLSVLWMVHTGSVNPDLEYKVVVFQDRGFYEVYIRR